MSWTCVTCLLDKLLNDWHKHTLLNIDFLVSIGMSKLKTRLSRYIVFKFFPNTDSRAAVETRKLPTAAQVSAFRQWKIRSSS